MSDTQRHGLGRLYIPDERDARFPMSSVLAATERLPDEAREAVDRGWRYWNQQGWWGDQGDTPRCVVYAWGHYVEDGPVTHKATPHGEGPPFDLTEAYGWAQRNDQWPGEGYDGTSVRAGAQYLRQLGHVGSFVWARDMDDLVRALLTEGPVVIGTWWYREMFDPDEDGFLTVGGPRDGGHAYLLNGVNVGEGKVRVKNSWGQGWGDGGNAWMRLDDVDRLVFAEAGEACLAVETEVRPV